MPLQQFSLISTFYNNNNNNNFQYNFDTIQHGAVLIMFLLVLNHHWADVVQMLHFYLSVIRPILEYCSPIWHHGLTKAQAESLEAIQRRALRIIDSSTVGIPYEVALSLTQFVSLHDRREHLNKIFFTSITIPSSCISRLLPPLRDSSITSRLCAPSLYPRHATRIKRYTSFIHHALLNYQLNILSPSHPVT